MSVGTAYISTSIAADITASERRRTRICIITATISAMSQATLLGIFTALVIIALVTTALRIPTLAAIVFNALVTLIMLAVVAGALQTDLSTTRSRHSRLEALSLLLSAGVSLITMVLSIFILARAWVIFRFTAASLSHSVTASLIVAGIILWSCTVITQVTTYVMLALLLHLFQDEPESITTIGYRYPTSSPRKRFSMSFKSHLMPTTPEKAHSTDPYTPSSASLRSLKSSRHGSATQVFGPLGSKTRLLISQSLHGRDNESHYTKREPSLEIACRGETPEPIVSQYVYELSSSPPVAKHPLPTARLETIPGSRPVSPARPLDGPFPQHDITPEILPLPESPTLSRTQSPASPLSTTPSHDLPFPPMIGEVAFQSHIHPLFRSGSPGPPPAMSPGTKVTASPHAGQIMHAESFRQANRSRSAQTSRAATPDVSPEPERVEFMPNFSRPGAASRHETRMMNMI